MFKDLYKTWSRLGVGFGETFSHQGYIKLEKAIIETLIAGREDSRLLFGMRGWLLKHHDLVNRSILIRLIKKEASTAALGAIIDSILEIHPRSGLQYVKKYCHPAKKFEFVFQRVAASSVSSKINRQNNLKIWKNWNLISQEMDAMEGAIADKNYVLKKNYNLALRALFGPGIRAEIFAYLIQNGEGSAYKISQVIGMSYEPVYSELQSYQSIGLMIAKKVGKSLVYRLKPHRIRRVLAPLLS